MTTVVLILLCLAIAGRELYLAFERKRAVEAGDAELASIRLRLADLAVSRERLHTDLRQELGDALREELREELRRALKQEVAARLDRVGPRESAHEEALRATDARIRSLISQVNERMLPEVNAQLAGQRETAERLSAELARLRAQLRARLDQSVAASLGAGPVDSVLGVLGGEVPVPARTTLTEAYEKCAMSYGLRVELAEPDGDSPWQIRYYLSGPSPRELERDFIDLVRGLRSGTPGPADPLVSELRQVEEGVAQLGPLLLVRGPESVVCGVVPLAELLRHDPSSLPADPAVAASRVRRLPQTRFCDLPGGE